MCNVQHDGPEALRLSASAETCLVMALIISLESVKQHLKSSVLIDTEDCFACIIDYP